MTKRELNALYCKWEVRTAVAARCVEECGFDYAVGFYNGHYGKNAQGEYERECYPIPVITVKGLCDVQLELDAVALSARLSKQSALQFDYGVLRGYEFEVYGVEDYLADYYVGGDIAALRENILKSDETEIEFQFAFPIDLDGARFADLLKLLQANGFYY